MDSVVIGRQPLSKCLKPEIQQLTRSYPRPRSTGSTRASRNTATSFSTSALIEEARLRPIEINGGSGLMTSGSTSLTILIVLSPAFRSIDKINDPGGSSRCDRIPGRQGPTVCREDKRTALLLAQRTLDNNALDGRRVIDPNDRELADLLVDAASGRDVESDVLQFFAERA